MGMPGGKLLSGFGGYLTVKNVGGSPVRIDVAGWELENIHINKECPHSGSIGAINRRRTGLDWKARCSIWTDADKPVEQYLRSGWGFAVAFYLSSLEAWTGYGLGQSYHYAPSALLNTIKTIDNSDGKDIIRQEITIDGNSLLFLLPLENAAWQVYYNQLLGLGQI
jgi:hypothetical protein